MIRQFCTEDTEEVVSLWLEATVASHGFIPREYWEEACGDMRELYLPASDEIVLHIDDASGKIDAFLAFVGDFLAALFVAPGSQGMGLGSRMLRIARRMHPCLTLSVYAQNARAVAFYRKNGFEVCLERVEEKTGCLEYLMEYRSDAEKA